MKFTNGYWMLKEEITPIYAVEYAGHEIQGNTLTVYAVQNHIRNRGDCLNLGVLVKKENGDVWQTDLWQPGMALVDFTNPDAAAWYASKLEALPDAG